MNKMQERNFRAALAQFVQEHLPLPDTSLDRANDLAWKIADRLEGRFLSEFDQVAEPQEPTP